MKDNIEKELIKDFQLPKYIAGKSFAEASKAIDNKFKDRRDTFAIKTKEELLERLAKAQEYVKMQDALKNQSQEIPDMMNGQIPPGMEEFMPPQQQMDSGGYSNRTPVSTANSLTPQGPVIDPMHTTEVTDMALSSNATSGSGMSDGLASGIGAGLSAAGYALSSKNNGTIAGDPNHNQYIDTTKDIVAGVIGPIGGLFRGIQKAGQGIGNAVGGEVGAGVADLFSPEESTLSMFTTNKDASWDEKLALTMPIVGGIANKRLEDRRRHEENMENTQIKNLQYDRDFAMGGYIDPTLKDSKDKNKENRNLQKDVQQATGINFDKAYVNEYFKYADNESASPVVNNVDLGQYKGRNFFNIKDQGSNVVITPTNKNPQNAQGYKDQLAYLKKLNPNTNLDGQYQQMDNRMMYGGYGAGETYPQPEGHPQYQYPNYYIPREFPVNEGLKSIKPDTELRANTTMPIGYGQNIQPEKKNTFGKTVDWLGQNYGDIMSYAPAIGALTQKIDRPNTARGTRLDNTYQRQLVDEAALQNSVNQNNMQGALTNNSGGDLGALRSNLIAGNLAKTKALSDAYLRAEDMNRNENRTAQQFNLNRDMTNLQQDERYIDRKARDEAAYSGAIADRRKAVLDNIGNIGREESNKKLVKQLFGYTWNGKYWTDSEGNKVSAKEVADAKKVIADAKKYNKKDKE